MLAAAMFRSIKFKPLAALALMLLVVSLSVERCDAAVAQMAPTSARVDLMPIEVDLEDAERRNFGSLRLLSAFQLNSKDRRFGGLSGLSIADDGRLYAISDRGYLLSATTVIERSGVLSSLVDWRIAPLLTRKRTPVNGRWRDAEALARAPDGSFLVAFEGVHRIWRYPAPPQVFESAPRAVEIPPAVSRAPTNGGIEALTVLPDGRLLALTEEFENRDGSFKGWLIGNGVSAELSYVPAGGFRVTDCTALDNGDVLVLERRYVFPGSLSARVTLVKAGSLKPGARLVGKELLMLEHPLAAENYEGITAARTPQGTIIFIVSDDNYGFFQQTLLLQFLLPNPRD